MGFRGRGRGRGGSFGGGYFVKELAYEVFPKEFTPLVKWGNELPKFWTTSPYYLDQHSAAQRNGSVKKAPLSDFMMLTDDYVPVELFSRNVKRSYKKVRWDAQSDLQRLDLFEKLDRDSHGQDGGDKKEDEDEDADNENVEEEEEESGDDDYAKNIDFDDDDDDYNQMDDGGGMQSFHL